MKTVAFINPNSTDAMTDSCVETLRSELPEFYKVKGITNYDGPAAIEGEKDGIAAIPGLLAEIEKNSDCDSFIIGCFDDTGLIAQGWSQETNNWYRSICFSYGSFASWKTLCLTRRYRLLS